MTSGGFRRRFWGAFLGNAVVRGIRMAEQLLLVPVLLAGWGAEQYGEWIALISIASFAAIANLGIGHAALSDIVLCFASGRKEDAARSFLTSVVAMSAALAIGFLLLSGVLVLFGLQPFITLNSISPAEARTAVLLLSATVLLSFYAEPLTGVLGAAVGAYAANTIYSASKIVELLGIAAAVYFGAGPVTVAAIMLAGILLNLLVDTVVALWVAPWISFRPRDFDVRVLDRAWKASLGFFALWVCVNLLNLQVTRLVVFHFFGATALAVFAVLAMYIRTARAMTLMIAQSAQIEIGRIYAQERADGVRPLVEAMIGWAVLTVSLLLVAAIAIAPFVIPLWTHGQVPINWALLVLLALVAVAGTCFDMLMATAAALSRVGWVAIGYGTGLAAGLAGAVLLNPWTGVWIVGVALLLPELGGIWGANRTFRDLQPPLAIRVGSIFRLSSLRAGGLSFSGSRGADR